MGAARSVSETSLLAVIWVCFSVATLFAALRLTVRFRGNGFFLADDYCIMFAWATLLTMAALQTEQLPSLWYITYLRAGRLPIDERIGPETIELTRWQFPVILIFWTILWAVKASFLAVFYRLVRPFPILRRLWYCVATFVALAYIGCWIADLLTCNTLASYFEPGTSPCP